MLGFGAELLKRLYLVEQLSLTLFHLSFLHTGVTTIFSKWRCAKA
jgi:hypothetical protein